MIDQSHRLGMRAGRLLSTLVCTLVLMLFGTTAKGQSRLLSRSNAVQTAIATSTAPAFVGLLDVTFIDAQHGWMLADEESNRTDDALTVEATTDGGQTWTIVSTLYSAPYALLNGSESEHQAWQKMRFFDGFDSWFNISSNPNQVTGLRFLNALDGWAFGPDLLATHDGGKTWHKQAVDGDVLALEITSNTLWILQTTCTTNLVCNSTIRRSTDNGQTWQSSAPLAEQIPVRLVVTDAQTAWILHDINADNAGILVTYDGGKSWNDEPLPFCDGNAMDFAASDAQNLWFACGTEGGTNVGAKFIFASTDGGKSWQLRGKAALSPEADDNMPLLGTIEHIYTFSSQSAWLTLYRNAAVITTDGGKTWLQMDYGYDLTNMGGVWRLTSVDPLHIWYYNDAWLWYTNDGGSTWMCRRALSYLSDMGCSQFSVRFKRVQ